MCLGYVCLSLGMFGVVNGTGGRPPEGFALLYLLKTESPVDKIFKNQTIKNLLR